MPLSLRASAFLTPSRQEPESGSGVMKALRLAKVLCLAKQFFASRSRDIYSVKVSHECAVC
jgi:hypothetical protein